MDVSISMPWQDRTLYTALLSSRPSVARGALDYARNDKGEVIATVATAIVTALGATSCMNM